MDWLTVVATLVGGAAALLGTVLAQTLSGREERRRVNVVERRDSYIAYLVSLDGAFSALRTLADPAGIAPGELEAGTQRAMSDAGVYRNRERLLLAGSPSVLSPAEIVLRRLAVMRDAVRAGARRRTPQYHEPYHAYAEALWRLRQAIRADIGSASITLADLERETWDSRATCEQCQKWDREAAAARAIPAQTNPST